MKEKKILNREEKEWIEQLKVSKNGKISKMSRTNAPKNSSKIIGVMFFIVGIFITMMVYMGYFVATNEQEMINNSYNHRQELILAKNYRGAIYSADGYILAQTGLNSNGEEVRHYPYDNMFSHVVGFSTRGRTGIEDFANYYLINSDISLKDKIENTTAGKKNPGNNAFTTLSYDIQQAAYQAMGIYEGAVIVTEVSTGKILAMVSKPDYNPNTVVEMWDKWVEDEESSVLLNRVTTGLYPPGSTFKIMSTLEYIKENKDNYQKYSYTCRGSYKKDGMTIHCYHNSVHNTVNLTKSFAKSCNTSFVNLAMGLDRAAFSETLDKLLYGKNLNLDFLTAVSQTPINEQMSDKEMLQASIGQGTVQITPIHLNMITSAIANKGVLMRPYLVDRIESATGSVVHTYKAKEYGRLMSEEESDALRVLMKEVVENGTANRIKGYGYTVAGKTGSAEYNSLGDSHAWFTGFAPAENPEIAITVIIESAGAGGDYAVPIARRVLDAYFK